MRLKLIEVTNGFNWGKFAIGQFEPAELAYRSQIDDEMGVSASLIVGRGWGPEHFFFLDLQTGEGALFRHGGLASADLRKHRIWVCPMAEPALTYLYRVPLAEFDALPGVITLTEAEAPSSMHGYRRPGPDITSPGASPPLPGPGR